MIPVAPRPEPSSFNSKVRQRGKRWLKSQGFVRRHAAPAGVEIPPYWRGCLADLHAAYDGICAYLCIYIERDTGGASVDHYIAKSEDLQLAYEWSNYRFACSQMNASKGTYDDVLDPFRLTPETFRLELVSGRIYPNPTMPATKRKAAQRTIDRLGLDAPEYRELRARRYSDYLELRGRRRRPEVEDNLRRTSPFLYDEARRQSLL